MTPFDDLLAQGAGNAWFFIPSAILLGALHGLEPGHSKTMMAAFIVAIRGTVWQAVMLGLAATVSHTLVVWAIALAGMWLYQGLDAEAVEPYLQIFSAVIIIGLAVWMIARNRRDRQMAAGHHHSHASESREVNTGHGLLRLGIHGDGQPPHWRVEAVSGQFWAAQEVTVETERPDGSHQRFRFAMKNSMMESTDPIPEPHVFIARLTLDHGGHSHGYDLSFAADTAHDAPYRQGLQLASDGHHDAHALAHANDIRRRFDGRAVTSGQILLFGLTGGLLPCPAAITVLLLCLQLEEFSLGAVLVLCFSVGLALTLVTVGAVAAIGARHARGRFPWLAAIAARAPYLSGGLIILVGLYVGWHGVEGLRAAA